MTWYRPIDVWRLRQARRAACATIRPLIEGSRRRLLGIPESTWRDPYVIGLLSMLVTLHASRRSPPLVGDTLGLLQAQCLAEITGMHAAAAGAEICLLSTSQNRSFLEGCRRAAEVFAVLDDADLQWFPTAAWPSDGAPSRGCVDDVWEHVFERHVTSQHPTLSVDGA